MEDRQRELCSLGSRASVGDDILRKLGFERRDQGLCVVLRRIRLGLIHVGPTQKRLGVGRFLSWPVFNIFVIFGQEQ